MRNVRLNFRQQERSHLMENMIYNDLIRRGYSVDVGIVELTRIIEGRRRSSQYKIDFVVNVGNDRDVTDVFSLHFHNRNLPLAFGANVQCTFASALQKN